MNSMLAHFATKKNILIRRTYQLEAGGETQLPRHVSAQLTYGKHHVHIARLGHDLNIAQHPAILPSYDMPKIWNVINDFKLVHTTGDLTVPWRHLPQDHS